MASDPFKNLTTRHKKGEVIYKDGDLGNEMYVVQSGAVRIFRGTLLPDSTVDDVIPGFQMPVQQVFAI